MLIKFLSNCRADGKAFVIGEVSDLPDGIAKELVLLNRAAPEDPEVIVEAPIATATTEELKAPAPRPASRRAAPKPTPAED